MISQLVGTQIRCYKCSHFKIAGHVEHETNHSWAVSFCMAWGTPTTSISCLEQCCSCSTEQKVMALLRQIIHVCEPNSSGTSALPFLPSSSTMDQRGSHVFVFTPNILSDRVCSSALFRERKTNSSSSGHTFLRKAQPRWNIQEK